MPKRGATRELNHDNWDEEEEDDENEGNETFKEATPEVLSKRVIKVGKRRVTGGRTADSPFGASKPFANFTGFSTGSSSEPKPLIGLFSNAKPPQSNGLSLFGNTPKSSTVDEKEPAVASGSSSTTEDSSRLVYLSKLRKLNEDVTEWIQAKVKENPTCVLSPIFDDYRKYLSEIETERDKDKCSPAAPTSTPGVSTTPAVSSASVPKTGSGFFADLNTNKPAFPAFNTNFNSGFFNNLAKPPENKELEEENEEPPKNDFKRVEEENSVFSQRVKVFVKKEQSFVERGVGQLYIKEVKKDDDIKHQLIVRADTNLGNLLVNVLLTDSIPASRRGKNNVNLICLPTPDEKTVTQVLLRVKTEGDADKLQEEIVKYKKGK